VADFSHAFSWRRWRTRFDGDAGARNRAIAEGRAPDASIEEVGAAKDNVGFDGRPIKSKTGNGQGSDNPAGMGWGSTGGGGF
jgi:hypothetical protein